MDDSITGPHSKLDQHNSAVTHDVPLPALANSQPDHYSSDLASGCSGGVLVIIAILGISGGIIRAFAGDSSFGSRSRAAEGADYLELTPRAVPFALSPGETCYWSVQATQMNLTESVGYQGSSAGASIRVLRGVYINTGSNRGKRVVTSAWAATDRGQIYITTARLVFVGSNSSIEVPRSRVMGNDIYSDGVLLARSNARSIFFTSDAPGLLGAIINRMVQGTLATPRPVTTPAAPRSMTPPINSPARQPTSTSGMIPGSLRVAMSGPPEKVNAALHDMHDAFVADLTQRQPDRANLVKIQRTPGPPLTLAASMAFMTAQTTSFAAALQFANTFHPVTTDGAMGVKMSVPFTALLEATLSLQANLARVNPDPTFLPVFRGLAETAERLYAELSTWPSVVEAAETAVSAGQPCDFRLPLNFDMSAVNNALSALRAR
jgi:hypothetical protein